MLNPAHSKEFFNAYREPVNFLKHADTDHDGLLPVYDIVRLTDFAILSTIVRLIALEEPLTSHMRAMLIVMGAQYPNVMNIDAFPALVDAIEQALQRSPTRGALAAYLRNAMMCDPDCKLERFVDFADVAAANAVEITRHSDVTS